MSERFRTLEHQATEEIKDSDDEFSELLKQVTSGQHVEEEKEEEPEQLADEVEEKVPVREEKGKMNILTAMMKRQVPTSATATTHHTYSHKKDLVTDAAPQTNLNKHLTDEFEKLLKAYINEKDKGRMHAYRKAIAALRGLPFKVENADQVKSVSGVGEKIRLKIHEILTTGKLKKADEMTQDEKQQTLTLLTRVWGVGVQTANHLYQQGIKTIEELRKNQYLLNDNQKIGLKYFEEFEQRIPREDVDQIVKIVRNKIEEISPRPGMYEAICCGSYRRYIIEKLYINLNSGRATCGDIDILMTKKDGTSFDGFLMKLVKALEGVLLTDHLTKPKMSPQGSENYMGVLSYKGLHRRIDLKVYPKNQFGYAVLYFTGSDYFNRSIRLFALKKGWSLSDHGLSRVIKTNKGQETILENIPCYTEEEVFNVIGVKYRPPEERDV